MRCDSSRYFYNEIAKIEMEHTLLMRFTTCRVPGHKAFRLSFQTMVSRLFESLFGFLFFIVIAQDKVRYHMVPSWNAFGAKLKRLDWVKNEVSSKDKIQMVPSWDQNGTKLLQKKTVYFIQILVLTSKAISLEDMMSAIGYKNRASFRRNYLDGLEKVAFVTKTIPEVQTSPDQKYKRTEKGKLFLAGYNDDIL